jgi:hypothetical protein
MKHNLQKLSIGQSLVFFVIISFALLAFIAVLVDGGLLFSMRRLSQNAADSGALAGARELCVSGNIQSAQIVAESYAETNNRARIGNVTSQNANATAAAGIVSVTNDIVFDTFFARIIGIDQLTAPAFAQAGCYPPSGAEGEAVVPIAWKCPFGNFQTDPVTGIKYCDMNEFPSGTQCLAGQNYMYIFFDLDFNQDGSLKSNQEIYWCSQWGTVDPSLVVYNPIVINCDFNGDNVEDVEIISPLINDHKWYWINTDGNACGASEENTIIQDGLTSPLFTHWWYPACSGDKASVYINLQNYRMGDTVIMPVFDDTCATSYPSTQTCGQKFHTAPITDQAVPLSGGNSNTEWFHLISFASFKISCVTGQSEKCDKISNNPLKYHARGKLESLNPGLISPSKKSIEGCFIRDFVPGLIPGDPANGVFSGTYTLVLIR